MSALAELIDACLTLRTQGDALIVAPASALTESMRQRIRQERAEIWKMFARPKTCPPR